MDDRTKQALINDFVNRSFRDVADKDYIAARMAYRYGLVQQFLWLALQCIEKYLKAILIYNGKDTRGIEHSLIEAYDGVLKISDINFDFPKNIEDFVKYLDAQGKNRYFEYPYYTMGEELFSLDRTVWHIRRYCFYLRSVIKKKDRDDINLFPVHLKEIQSEDMKKFPHRYRIFGFGSLEKIIKDKKSPIREQLVWKNFYYGTYKKKIIKRFTFRSSSGNPAHFLYPQIFPDLEKLVKFSKEVKNHFNNINKEKKTNIDKVKA